MRDEGVCYNFPSRPRVFFGVPSPFRERNRSRAAQPLPNSPKICYSQNQKGGFPMKIAILDAASVNPGDLSWSPVQALGDTRIYPATEPQDTVSRIADADAILINRVSLDRSQLSQCPALRYVGVFATGYNLIDIAAARDLGIAVANVPAYSTGAVAQAVFAFLLFLSSDISGHNALVKQGAWERPGGFDYSLTHTFELAGKTIGLVGFGHIGQQVAKLAQAFGMQVLAWCRHPRPEWESASLHFVPLEQLLAQSDFVSLHLPLTPETHHLIDREALAKLKPGASLINTARGGILDQQAAVEALDSGLLRWACIDVLETEPPLPGNPLLHHPRCIATPHVAWACRETRERVIRLAAENLAAFFAGEPQNVVNGVRL